MNSNILKGSVLALLAFFFMALFGILTKKALQSSHFIWVSFYAYLTAALFLLPYIIHQGISFLKSEHYGLLLGRAFFGTFASLLYTLSIQYIPIVNSTLLFNTAPIFIPLITVLFLKARVPKSVWLAVFLGFIGIVIIIHPTKEIFTQVGNLLGLLSGIFLAIAYLMMKILTDTEFKVRIIFYYLAIGCLIQAPFLPFFEHPDSYGAFYADMSGIALLTAQLLLVSAYKFADASELGVYQYASVVFVGLMDWMIWNMAPPVIDIVGILLVTLAGYIIMRKGSTPACQD